MSEKVQHKYTAIAVLSLAAASAAVVLLLPKPHSPAAEAVHTIDKCYDQPANSAPAEALTGNKTPLALLYSPQTNSFNNEPEPTVGTRSKLERGNVQISFAMKDGRSYGSGFVTTSPDGEQVIVTAAHVVVGQMDNPGGISITDAAGEITSVADGCYTFDYDGQPIPISTDGEPGTPQGPGFTDIAILMPKKPLAATGSLKLADTAPKKGEWLQTVNNQKLDEQTMRTPHDPAEYGFVKLSESDSNWQTVLSGLEPSDEADGELPLAALPGASGGLIANETGDVVGIINTVNVPSEESLKSDYNTELLAPRATEPLEIAPTVTHSNTSKAIRHALESTRYRDDK